MMKNLNYVNMFNHGVSEVQDLLKENQSPAAEFNINLVTAFSVIVREPEDDDSTNVVKGVVKGVVKDLSERQKIILDFIAENPTLTAKEMSEKMSEKTGIVPRTIQRDLADLQTKGMIVREGGRKEGKWVIKVK